MVQWIRKVTYKMELLAKLKIHPMFHVSMLKSFHLDKEELEQGESQLVPLGHKHPTIEKPNAFYMVESSGSIIRCLSMNT